MDIENIELIPGKDVTRSSKRWGLTLYVFWHSPSFNTGWYPLVQVDDDSDNDKTVFWSEGSENPADFKDVWEKVGRKFPEVDDWRILDQGDN